MTILNRLFEHYRAYHAYGPPRLKYMGYVGAISTTIFYFLRFTRPNPALFDDLLLRVIAVVLFTGLALKERWPDRLKPHYIAYSYWVLTYCLPCFTILTALQRGGGMPAISNAFIILCFLVLLTDWRNTLVMLALGTAMAVGIYVATTPNPRIPMDLIAQLPAYALIVLGGNLFKFSTEQIDAERKLRATQALAGSIAHEMRNPLGQLKHSLEVMRQALPSPTLSRRPRMLDADAVDDLYRELAQSGMAVKRGLQVISMTLDEVNAKPLDTSGFAYLSASEVCNKAVQEYGYQSADERDKVSVKVREDFSFRGDETAFLFVLFNLIKNALYYLPAQPDMRITLSVERNQITVSDNGPGIAPSLLPHLFEPFRSAGKSGGTGLGLAYCQRVMKAFGGNIACDSAQGQFTRFTMSFPAIGLQEGEAHRQAVLDAGRAAFSGKRLLVVDDDASLRMTTRHKLLPLGATVDEAANGQRALDMLARQPYDLVVLDLNMPVLDGYAVAQRIRAGIVAPANQGVRIVAYTSEPAHLASVKTQKAGMDGMVSKPCAQIPLVRALQTALESRRLPASDGAGALAGLRVLVADDSPHNRKAVAIYLKHAGASVAEAGHGQAVLEYLHAHGGCDAILMDLSMPGMDGLEATRAIRSGTAAWRNVPIIALTAHSDQASMDETRAMGMDDFLTKPVDPETLISKLHDLATGARGPGAARAMVPGETGEDLLDVARLESYRRIGMLDELLGDYLPEITRLIDALDQSVARQDFEASLASLHSLVGMSGEAGAQALHKFARAVYVPMVEQHGWPPVEDWTGRIKAIAARTEQALRAYGAAQATIKPA